MPGNHYCAGLRSNTLTTSFQSISFLLQRHTSPCKYLNIFPEQRSAGLKGYPGVRGTCRVKSLL